MTATSEEAMRAMCEGAHFGRVLQALTEAGAHPEPEGREGLHGPSVAVFGSGRTYRYLLTRRWAPGPVMTWLMCNPSVADSVTDDPTIQRCTKRAARAGFGGIAVVNLFALVATDPRELRNHPDPIGPGNDACLRAFCQPGDTVVAAWGSHDRFLDRGEQVTQMLRASGVGLLCLGLTTSGQPRHPGRVAYALELTPWEAA